MSQLALNITKTESFEAESFLISGCNEAAFQMVNGWQKTWNTNTLLLVGEKFSGKTHLSKIWQKLADAKLAKPHNISELLNELKVVGENIIIEDIDELPQELEENFFHLYNCLKQNDNYLLLTSAKPIYDLKFTLPDLRSRISSSLIANIEKPNEEFQKALFQKQFLEQQLKVSLKVIDYITPRIERSFEAIHKIVDILNKKSIETKRNITIPFVKEILDI